MHFTEPIIFTDNVVNHGRLLNTEAMVPEQYGSEKGKVSRVFWTIVKNFELENLLEEKKSRSKP